MSICLATFLSISFCLPVCLFNCLSITIILLACQYSLSIFLLVSLSDYPSLSSCLSFYLSVYLSIYLSIYLSTYCHYIYLCINLTKLSMYSPTPGINLTPTVKGHTMKLTTFNLYNKIISISIKKDKSFPKERRSRLLKVQLHLSKNCIFVTLAFIPNFGKIRF